MSDTIVWDPAGTLVEGGDGWSKSGQVDQLAAALSKAQAAMKGAVRDNANPFFKSRYADLTSVWDACREPLTANGLAVVQMPVRRQKETGVVTVLMHTSGQWIAARAGAETEKSDPQAIGSAITYLRRYALAAFAGVCPEDDDGNAGSGKTNGTPTPPPRERIVLDDDPLSDLTGASRAPQRK